MTSEQARHDGRGPLDLREISVERGFIPLAAGSALISFGNTKVLCTASVEERVPQWLRGGGRGWVTAEYALLPGSTGQRTAREAVKGRQSGRTHEIQRLIGRSLRAVCDLSALGEVQITLDCDVLQADGGTRTAAITGAYIALSDAIRGRGFDPSDPRYPLRAQCAAISVGVVGGEVAVDLDYHEDSNAEVDMNVVMDSFGEFIEVQGTGEGATFHRNQLVAMLDAAEGAIATLFDLQRRTLES